jgi:hypothetical protein
MSTKHSAEKTSIGPMRAALGVVATIPIVAPFVIASVALGIATHLFAGYLFALHWMVIKKMDLREFWPTLLGFLGGLGTAYLLFALPQWMGAAGYVIAGIVILVALFLFNLEAAYIVINPAYMIMLTLGTGVFHTHSDFAAGTGTTLLAAAYSGTAVVLVTRWLSARATPAGARPVPSL